MGILQWMGTVVVRGRVDAEEDAVEDDVDEEVEDWGEDAVVVVMVSLRPLPGGLHRQNLQPKESYFQTMVASILHWHSRTGGQTPGVVTRSQVPQVTGHTCVPSVLELQMSSFSLASVHVTAIGERLREMVMSSSLQTMPDVEAWVVLPAEGDDAVEDEEGCEDGATVVDVVGAEVVQMPQVSGHVRGPYEVRWQMKSLAWASAHVETMGPSVCSIEASSSLQTHGVVVVGWSVGDSVGDSVASS